jgi:CHASE3 domain sensor protein
MGEEQIIKLLEEIRDLQKQHVENYKDALKNQQESIDLQKSAVRRQKITVLVFGLLVLGLLAVLIWLAKG